MLAFTSMYPRIDLNESFYEDDDYRIGMSENKYYLVSKLNTTVLVYEKHPEKIMTFIDGALVDKLRYSSLKRLYASLGETNGSGTSKMLASRIKFILENINNANAEYVPSPAETYHNEIELLKNAYKNDCCTHLTSDISWQIKHFMKYAKSYDIRIYDEMSVHGMTKFLILIDEGEDVIYKAIIRDGKLYFTNHKREKTLRELFVKDNFNFYDYGYYESTDGEIINLFRSRLRLIESHYNPKSQQYTINVKHGFTNGRTMREMIDKEIINELLDENVNQMVTHSTINQAVYDENYIFNTIFESELIFEPTRAFINNLLELSIVDENMPITIEDVKIYEMTVI